MSLPFDSAACTELTQNVVNDSQLASNSPNPTGNQSAYFELEASLRSRWSGRTMVATDDNMAVEWHR